MPDITTEDILRQYADQPAAPPLPGKGERMRAAWGAYKREAEADMRRKAERAGWGETQPRELPWPLNKLTKATVSFPAKDSDAAEVGRTALMAPLGARTGMGPSGGFGRAYHGDGEPMAYHVPGGLGLFESPLTPPGFATQPREILGGVVAPMLSATKRDALAIENVDPDILQILAEEAGRTYTLKEQAKRVGRDLSEKPGRHAWEGLKQSGMWTGYTGLPEIATALAALRYLPLYLRAPEPPIRGSILDRPPAER